MNAALETAEAGWPLVFVELRNGEPTAGSLGVLGKARALAGHAVAVVCGPGSAAVAHTLGRSGADVAIYCDDPGIHPELPAPHVDVIAAILRSGGYRSVLFENSVVVADIAAALACRLEAGVVWDLQDLEERDGALVGRKLVLSDSVAVEAGWNSDVRIAVFRLGSFDPIEVGLEAKVERVEPAFGPAATAVSVVEVRTSTFTDVAVASADVIVAGGRGLRDRGFLERLDDLADAIGGVVAVSMPLVDRGWLPHSRQVGQTGNKVRPRLYLACGISGQLGHRVGMEKSGLIVAINTDETAPIFGICDAGLIGDLHEVVPELTRRIRAAHGEPSPP